MGRLRRGHSLEVIFEEETADFQPSIARLEEEELTDEWKNYRRLSRRQILFQQQQESGQGSSSSSASSVQVTLCSQCCHPTEMDSGSATMDQTTTNTTTTTPNSGHIPARRRNSTYLALACANAVSQGAMTRSLRQMFETQPVREAQPLLSRAEIKQQIQAARLRRNSIAVLYPSGASGSPENIVTATPAVVVVDAIPTKQQPPPPTPAKPTTVSSPPSTPLQFKLPASPVDNAPVDSSSPLCIRCDKCSSILTSPPVAVSLVIHSGKSLSAAVAQPTVARQEKTAEGETKPVANVEEERTMSPSKIIPTNREVVEEELPKPDTVKNARCLFESSFMEASSNFSTLQHVKSNPSSKILRSESSMTLDRVAGTRSSSVTSRPPPFRWPSRQEHARNRSPSPSPSPSPIPALVIPAKSHHKMTSSSSTTLPSYYRSSPSLTQYRSSRHSLHSTDVESYVSEGGSDCWSSSDLESEASYSSLSGGGGGGTGRDELSDSLDGMRYISPDVMEKIRSYGMTLTFVNGKMVDEDDDDQEEPEVMAKEAATRKVVQSIRSAGQSQPITATTTKSTPPVSPPKKQQQMKEKLLKSASPPPRIVACLPKQETVEKAANNNNNNNNQQFTKKIRHSSGESSASSGVSSGTNAGSDSSSSSSEHNSPFASLKRTKSANADHTVERSPSPGPRQSGTRKAVGSSPFGCYSVVYSFNASARSPMYV